MTNGTAVQGLIRRWQAEARAKRNRANELGNCAAGLELFTEATMLDACADEAGKTLVTSPPSLLSRPANAVLPPPSLEDALSTAGVLFHYVGGSPELRERLAKWLEHHEGDLDDQTVLWYLTACHALLEPDCTEPMGWDAHPGRQR